MTTAQVVETSVTVSNNSPIQDYVHPDDQTQPNFEMTPGFKPFTVLTSVFWSITQIFCSESCSTECHWLHVTRCIEVWLYNKCTRSPKGVPSEIFYHVYVILTIIHLGVNNRNVIITQRLHAATDAGKSETGLNIRLNNHRNHIKKSKTKITKHFLLNPRTHNSWQLLAITSPLQLSSK